MLELTYTAHDRASLARDMKHADITDELQAPFAWDEDRSRAGTA